MSDNDNSYKHDNSYGRLFSHPEMVTDLLKGFIHETWVAECDFSTLEKPNGNYKTDDIRHRTNDIVWKVRCGPDWIYIYILLEFQSSVDRHMANRIMGYLSLLYQDLIVSLDLKRGKALLPPVVPIVLYNGDRKWNAPVEISDLIHPHFSGLDRFRPRLSFLLLDESQFADKELPEYNLVSALFRLENSQSKEEIDEVLNLLIYWLGSPEKESLMRAFISWFDWFFRKKDPDGTKYSYTSLQEVRSMLSTTIDSWISKGKAEGKVEGIAEGKVEGIAEGEARGEIKGERKLFLKIAGKRFGVLNTEQMARVNVATLQELDSWSDRLLEPSILTLDDLFASTH